METHGNQSAVVTARRISVTQALQESVADSAAQDIRDDLIEQDVLYRRVDAGVRREVDARLAQMGLDLKKLMLDIDVAGTQRKDARQRRLKRLNIESRILIRTAYSEVGGILRAATRRVAKVEAKKAANVMRKNIP
jgi:hypothetical protein